jgi:putative hydrolase of the HAD superfamily
MIRAIIFDCFGVLATDGWLPFRDEHFGHDPTLLERATISNKRVDAGLQSYDDFVRDISDLSGVEEREVRRAIEHNVPNKPLLDYIRDELKPHYRIGFLSNAGANWLDDIFEPWQVDLFDEVLLSYQIGAVKPEPIMYETILARLGVLPEEALFIDDQPRYVEGARELGIKAIQYKTYHQTKHAIEEML